MTGHCLESLAGLGRDATKNTGITPEPISGFNAKALVPNPASSLNIFPAREFFPPEEGKFIIVFFFSCFPHEGKIP